MIKRLTSDGRLDFLLEKNADSPEGRKLLALRLCYGTKYDFCRFYEAEGAVLCGLSDSFVLHKYGNADYEELAGFFEFSGFSEIFCSANAGRALSALLGCSRKTVNAMSFRGKGVPADTENDTPLTEFYEILKHGFDIEFEPWYLDISHRVRHGVSATRRLGDSVLVIQHDLRGEALLSQITTLPMSRGKGSAARLILAVCAELSPSEVCVICEDELADFYKNIGFERVGEKCVLTP